MKKKASFGLSLGEMREQISEYCAVEGFMREAATAYTMPDEDVAPYFDSLFETMSMDIPEGEFEF